MAQQLHNNNAYTQTSETNPFVAEIAKWKSI